MDTMIRLKTEELARLRVMRGFRLQRELAEAAGMHPQHLSQIIGRADVSGITLGSIGRLCEALSTGDRRVRIEDLVEYIPDQT